MATYRGKNVPSWWLHHLPPENNPFTDDDWLELDRGCLVNFWHCHSSNKHFNAKGVQARNRLCDMAAQHFGEIFLVHQDNPLWCRSGRQGERLYTGESLRYENAQLSEDKKQIQILNARQYYEDVIAFLMQCLRVVSENHYPPCQYTGSWSLFFPDVIVGSIDGKIIYTHLVT